MSNTVEAIELVKLLKPKIGEQAATKLVNYADNQSDKTIDRLWVVLLGGFSILITVILYLHIDIKSEMNRRFGEQKEDIKEIRELILRKR